MDGFDLEVGLGGPTSPPPDGGGEPTAPPPSAPPAAPPAAPGAGDDFVTLQVKDEEFRVPRGEFQAFADYLGWDPNELGQALQIGRDGRNLYRGIASEKERLRQAWEELELRGRSGDGRPTPAPAGTPTTVPAPASGSRPRPPVEDVMGHVVWLGDQVERMMPMLERLPSLEERLARSAQDADLRSSEALANAERATANRAYSEVAANWEREGLRLPPQEELEQFLRRFPITDDLDMDWPEVWDKAGWMVSGPRNMRMAMRRQVLDAQTPRTTAPVPAAHRTPGGASPSARPPAPSASGYGHEPKSNEQLLAEAAEMERQLSGISVADVAPHLSRR